MKKYRIRIIGIILIINGVLTINVSAREYVEAKTYNAHTATDAGKSLYLNDTQGDIVISGWNKDRIEATVKIELKTDNRNIVKEFFDATDVQLESYHDGYRLAIDTPREQYNNLNQITAKSLLKRLLNGKRNAISVFIKIDVKLPKQYGVNVENKYGDVVINDVTGELMLDNHSGEIAIEKCGGEIDIKNSYGKIELTDFGGPAKIRCNSGAVSARDIAGATVIDNSYKPIEFENWRYFVRVRICVF